MAREIRNLSSDEPPSAGLGRTRGEPSPPESAPGYPEPYSIKRHGVTVTNCDAEPIQTPGCIQPHGLLLALSETDMHVTQVSENSAAWLGRAPGEILGLPLSAVLGDHPAATLADFLRRVSVERNPSYAFTVDLPFPGGSKRAEATVHTQSGAVIVELEEAVEPPPFGAVDRCAALETAITRLEAAPDVEAFCQAAAEEVRSLTSLDRVLVYRFHPDLSGEVIGEAKRPDLCSWLGLRYPKDDIPRPAREIFMKIWARALVDARAEPCEIVPLVSPVTGEALDMTYCLLRGASVMYTEYLQNMGVTASLTMAIRREGGLWGLITGHHATPARLPREMRAAAGLVAQLVSLELRNVEERQFLQERIRIESVHHQLLARAAQTGSLAALVNGSPNLLDGISATGAAVRHRGRWHIAGRCPSEPCLEEIAGWLESRPELDDRTRPLFAASDLPAAHPPCAPCAKVASGLLAVPVSRGRRDLILWFLPEQEQTYNWGGNPYEKPTVLGPNGPRLTPRRSFEIWQEQVRGQSRAWRPFELDVAAELRLWVLDLVVGQAEHLNEIHVQLARSNQELDAFAHVAAHDLKEPLRSIRQHSRELLENAEIGRPLSDLNVLAITALCRITLRMEDLLSAILHFTGISRSPVQLEEVALGEVLTEAVEMLGPLLERRHAEIRVPRPLPRITCDRMRVREILFNLISNALRYNHRERRWVEIGFTLPGEPDPAGSGAARQQIFHVRDNGIGIAPKHHDQIWKMFKRIHPEGRFGEGAGAGLTLTRKLVEQHGGRIWVDSRLGEGTTFNFTLAAEPPEA